MFIRNRNAPANSFSGGLVVTSDDNNTDTGGAAADDGVEYFLTGRVQHADDADEGEVDFVCVELSGVAEVHFVGLHWVVSSSEGQATKSVTAGTVLTGEV